MKIRALITFSFNEMVLTAGTVADLPSLNAKAAIAAGKAEPEAEDSEISPETVADQVNNANKIDG